MSTRVWVGCSLDINAIRQTLFLLLPIKEDQILNPILSDQKPIRRKMVKDLAAIGSVVGKAGLANGSLNDGRRDAVEVLRWVERSKWERHSRLRREISWCIYGDFISNVIIIRHTFSLRHLATLYVSHISCYLWITKEKKIPSDTPQEFS